MGKLPEKKGDRKQRFRGRSTAAGLSNTSGLLPSSRNYTGLLISHLAVRVSAGRIITAGLSNTGEVLPSSQKLLGFLLTLIWLCPIITHSAKTANVSLCIYALCVAGRGLTYISWQGVVKLEPISATAEKACMVFCSILCPFHGEIPLGTRGANLLCEYTSHIK